MKAEFYLNGDLALAIRHEPETDHERILLHLYELAPRATLATAEAEDWRGRVRTLEAELEEARDECRTWQAASQQAEAEAQRQEGSDAERGKAIDEAWDAIREAMPRNDKMTLAAAITHLNEVRVGTIRILEDDVRRLSERLHQREANEHAVQAAADAIVPKKGLSLETRRRIALAAVPSEAAKGEMRRRHAQGYGLTQLASEQWESGIGTLRRFTIQIIRGVVNAAPKQQEPEPADDQEDARL